MFCVVYILFSSCLLFDLFVSSSRFYAFLCDITSAKSGEIQCAILQRSQTGLLGGSSQLVSIELVTPITHHLGHLEGVPQHQEYV